ncbi:MAG: LysR family transcriptional regulator, low CO2-responsive transcriptional regulator [Clostridiales bacterium]|nr:LysR family transcriptional regulator, low CO2-responsive transcriptional regulator [Clostridiales bacterium]
MINHKQLLTLKMVAEESSYSLAAKKLFITQPAVSLQIKAIEQITGFQIFERSDGELALTPSGRILYEHANIILNQYDTLNDFIRQSQSVKNGTLKIATSTIPGEYILPKLIYEFRKHFPNILADVEISDSSKVVNYVLNGEYEIGLVGFRPTHRELSVKQLWPERLKLIKPVKLPFEPTSLRQIIEQPLIIREDGSGTRDVVMRYLSDHGISSRSFSPTAVFGSTRAVISAVEAGLGIGWVSELAIKEPLHSGRISVLDERFDILRHFYLITRKKRTLSPLSDHFIQFLEAVQLSE